MNFERVNIQTEMQYKNSLHTRGVNIMEFWKEIGVWQSHFLTICLEDWLAEYNRKIEENERRNHYYY